MLVASIAKKLLWVLRYPSFPSKLVGPYAVGAIQTRLRGSTKCQIHYPADTKLSKRSKKFRPYFRPEAVEGVAAYSRTNPSLLSFLSGRNHPCIIGAEPIQNDDGGFPIVVFSHGLGGCMEMYTILCQQIASQGYWVVALEHEDGSGAYAENKAGEVIPYKRPDDTPYSRQKVLNFRRPFLRQRVQETTAALECILSPSSHNDIMDPNVQRILQAAKTSRKEVALLGHSFGGSTMVMAAKEYLAKQRQTPSSPKTIRPTSLNVLDPWAFSLEDMVLQEGVSSIPTFSILSESWLSNPETDQVKQLLENSEKVTSLYVPNSVHASFADSVSWLPGFIMKRLYMRGKQEKRHETIRSVAEACVKHIQMKGGEETADEYGMLQPFPIRERVDHINATLGTEEPIDSY